MQHEERRRRRFREDEKRDVLARWKASGLGAKSFARQEGMSAANLWRWKEALSESEKAETSKLARRATISFAPVRVSEKREREDAETCAEIVMDGRVRVRVFAGADMSVIGALVRELSRWQSC